MGRPVDTVKDEKIRTKVPESLANEMLRLANTIWMSEKVFANFPPKSSSFDVRLILVDRDAVKDIKSYGTPKAEIEELFNLVLKAAPQ
jgi:hypothetical protein